MRRHTRIQSELAQTRRRQILGNDSILAIQTAASTRRNMVSLGEGGTPLHKADRLAKTLGLTNLYLKDETRNPTNTYRDRAAALLTSNAIDQGPKPWSAQQTATWEHPCRLRCKSRTDLPRFGPQSCRCWQTGTDDCLRRRHRGIRRHSG